MSRSISLVAARKDRGRIVEEVGRTGTAVSLTRRGKVVARIVPEERRTNRDHPRRLFVRGGATRGARSDQAPPSVRRMVPLNRGECWVAHFAARRRSGGGGAGVT